MVRIGDIIENVPHSTPALKKHQGSRNGTILPPSICESTRVRVEHIFTRQHTRPGADQTVEVICDMCRHRQRLDVFPETPILNSADTARL